MPSTTTTSGETIDAHLFQQQQKQLHLLQQQLSQTQQQLLEQVEQTKSLQRQSNRKNPRLPRSKSQEYEDRQIITGESEEDRRKRMSGVKKRQHQKLQPNGEEASDGDYYDSSDDTDRKNEDSPSISSVGNSPHVENNYGNISPTSSDNNLKRSSSGSSGSGNNHSSHQSPTVPTVPNFFEWSRYVELGVVLVDKQHKVLIDYLNQLNEFVKNDNERWVIGHVLDGLLDYTKYHFKEEEELMDKYHYPSEAGHKMIHEGFIQKVLDVRSRYIRCEDNIGQELLEFLKIWLVDHILQNDRLMCKYVRENGEPEDIVQNFTPTTDEEVKYFIEQTMKASADSKK